MCGIAGVVAKNGSLPSADEVSVVRMRDRLSHRGPDRRGLASLGPAIFGHTRLAVLDPSSAGAQPMQSPCGRKLLVYNGELYNDGELRRELEAEGVRFSGHCDAETVLHALDRWGDQAFHRFRGMFAIAWLDLADRSFVLARDPLGVKPLYWWSDGQEVAFASEIPALLRHPTVPIEPDLQAASAYLTTIRTTVGEHTLFKGVRTLEPGQHMRFELDAPSLRPHATTLWPSPAGMLDEADADVLVRQTIEESVLCHLRSDVPVCMLLSGGLDSTIIAAAIARRRANGGSGPVNSYCAGMLDGDAESPDFSFARVVARRLGLTHTEVAIGEKLFQQRWPEMIERLGMPLSTPNEIAIHEVSQHLRREGHIVALSGEGADELFAGYELPTRRLFEHVQAGNESPWLAQVDQSAWIARNAKPAVFRERIIPSLEDDRLLIETSRRHWDEQSARTLESDPLATHLAVQRRTNLDNLLRRLDTATMLAGVEGRTPFADIAVAQLAERLPMSSKFRVLQPALAGAQDEQSTIVETKRVLRRAFEDAVPRDILERPKASFPLPFQAWMGHEVGRLRTSSFARELFTEASRVQVAQQPETAWHFAWPMLNLTIWGDAHWG